MKLISWNVNGLRACVQKGFLDQFNRLDADFFCLQETKMQPGQLELELPGYLQYWHSAEKKGYSGTAIFTKHVPLSVSYGLDEIEPDTEGRVITLEYPEFYLVNCYTPNAQRGLARIDFRMRWDEAFRQYLARLDGKKPVIVCGDLNVAHQEIDLKNPGSNRGNAGFSDQERESFTKTLSMGFTDTFRYLHPDAVGAYTWWSYMFNARQNNAGWRIDYFLVSDRTQDKVYATPIYNDILGSDHCPVGLEIDLPCNGSIWMEKTILPVKEKEVTKEKLSGKTIAKVCVMGLAALGLIVGIARIRPAESLQTEVPGQSQTEATAPTTDKTGRILVNVGMEALAWKRINNPTFLFEMTIGSETMLAGQDFTAQSGEVWNCWAFLEINYVTDSGNGNISNVRCNIETAEKLCSSAMAAMGSGVSLKSCRIYRQDGKIAGWLVTGSLVRSTGLRLELNLAEGDWAQEIVLTPRFTKAQAAEMSTEELADYAAHLDVFKNAEGGIEFYREQAKDDPALAELEMRTDAGEWIAIIADRNPELKSAEFLKSVFPLETSLNVRELSQAEVNSIDIKRLVWWGLQDEQLAKDLLSTDPDQQRNVWSSQYCAMYPAFQRIKRQGRNELLEYLYSYQGTQIQQLAAVLYDCSLNGASTNNRFYNYKVQEARSFLRVVTDSEAQSMTTEELVERATNAYLHASVVVGGVFDTWIPNYSSSVLYPLLTGAAVEESHYRSLLEEYAVLREMESREDAADCLFSLLQKAKNGEQLTSGWFFLRQYVYVKKMNPEQVQTMIRKALADAPVSYVTTPNLVKSVMEYVMHVAGQESGWYQQAVADYPVMAELEKRPNAAEEVLRYVSALQNNTPRNRDYAVRLLDREIYWDQMTAEHMQKLESLMTAGITEEEAKAMTTAQLAEKVTLLTELLNTTAAGSVAFENLFTEAYAGGQENYAVIRELESRQDVVPVLLSDLEQCGKSDLPRLRLILRILELNQYQQKMTPTQAEVYVSFAEQYLWNRKLTEMTTNNYARKCLSMGFWVRELSGAENTDAAYRKIRREFSPLVELQNRKDFIDELLFFLDPSNLSVTQTQRESAKVLLCLDNFYSKMTAEQQLMMAQMLLGQSFADGDRETTVPAVEG